MNIFPRGPYGEILPPPLTAHTTPQQALDRLVRDTGTPVHVPRRGRSLEGMYNVALVYAHQLRLREVLAGQYTLEVEAVLYRVVMEEGQPLSLRPPTLEALALDSFAPVLTYLGDHRWQVGLPGHGKVTTFTEADPARAVARAQDIFATWAEADEVAFLQAGKRAMRRHPRHLFHEYWLWVLETQGEWVRDGGYRLVWHGRHNEMDLWTPQGLRPLDMDRLQAVHMTDALAWESGIPPPWPRPEALDAWLEAVHAPRPQAVTWSPRGLPATLWYGREAWALVEREDALVVYPVRGGRYGKPAARSALVDPLRRGLARSQRARAVVARWALWRALGGSPGRSHHHAHDEDEV